jgi:hypothetical protein
LSQISQSIRDNSRQYLASTTDLEEVVRQLNGIVNAFTVDITSDTTPDLAQYPPSGLDLYGDALPLESRVSAG